MNYCLLRYLNEYSVLVNFKLDKIRKETCSDIKTTREISKYTYQKESYEFFLSLNQINQNLQWRQCK